MSTNTDSPAQLEVVQESNSVIVDVRPTDKAIILPSENSVTTCRSEGQLNSFGHELVTRSFLIKSFSWKPEDPVAGPLVKLRLPNDIFNDTKIANPVLRTLCNYAMFRSTIVIQARLNSNPFQQGALIMSYVPQLDVDAFSSKRLCIAARSQQPHVFLFAQTDSNATLEIPFNNVLTYHPITKTPTLMTPSDHVTLSVAVFNRLTGPDSPSASVSLFLSFKDIQFHGMISKSISVPPQMFSLFKAAMASAEAGLHQINKDINRDNPTDPFPPTSIVPGSSHSWCAGKNSIEKLSILRLDPLATTPHYKVEDEMKVSHIVQKPGYIKTFEITDTLSAGTWIMRVPIVPIHSDFETVINKFNANTNTLPDSVYPPVSVVSSAFAYASGGLDIRFDFMATKFHRARIMFALVPNVGSNTINLNEAMGSNHASFDIAGINSITIRCPFLSNHGVVPVYNNDRHVSGQNFAEPTSYLHLYILDPLIATTKVVSKVPVNVFVSASPNYNLSVPLNTEFGLGIDSTFANFTSGAGKVKYGYDPVYLGSWNYFHNATKLILRYGPVTDHITQFDNVDYDTIYEMEPNPGLKYQQSSNVVAAVANVWIRPRIPDQLEYAYLIPIKSLELAKAYLLKPSNDGLYSYLSDLPDYTSIKDCLVKVLYQKPNLHTPVPEIDVPEVIEFRKMENLSPSVYHGETFDDLKDYCRRYQFYSENTISISNADAVGQGLLMIPICPGGVTLNIKDTFSHVGGEIPNRIRNGFIPILASAFRHFRGSLRMKIIVSSSSNITLGIVHVPEKVNRHQTVVKINTITNNDFSFGGHAMYAQSTRVNQIFEIEVPYYSPHDYIFAGRSTSDHKGNDELLRAMGMGSLLITNFQTNDFDKPCVATISVAYAFGDDARFSTFIGFPSVCYRSYVPTLRKSMMVPQRRYVARQLKKEDESISGDMITVMVPSYTPDPTNPLIPEMDTAPQIDSDLLQAGVLAAGTVTVGLLANSISSTNSNVSDAFEKISVAADSTSDFMGTANRILNTIRPQEIDVVDQEGLMSIIFKMVGVIPESVKSSLRSVLSNLVHVLINPTIKTLAWACVCIFESVFHALNYSFSSCTSTVYKALKDYLSFYFQQEPNQLQQVPPQLDIQQESGYVATVVIAIAALLGFTGNLTGFISMSIPKLMKDITAFTMSANCLTTFVKNNFTIIKSLIRYIWRETEPDTSSLHDLSTDEDGIKKWVEESLLLIDPSSHNNIKGNPNLIQKVFVNCSIGRGILAKILSTKQKAGHVAIAQVLNRLQVLEEDLIACRLAPPARFEPFVLHLAGPPNIGKSFIITDICKDMLRDVGVTTRRQLIYTRNVGNPYWNNLDGQPVVVYDDFLAMRGSNEEMTIAELFSLKSSVVFNPPQAELEKKRQTYNPLIAILTSNSLYPPITMANSVEAVYRRRDLLIEVRKKLDYETTHIDDIPDEVLSTYGHLEFSLQSDPSNESKNSASAWFGYYSFKILLNKRFGRFYSKELINYQQRVNAWKDLLPAQVDETFQEFMTRSNTTYSDLLNSSISTASSSLRTFMEDVGLQYANVNLPEVNTCPHVNGCCNIDSLEMDSVQVDVCSALRGTPEEIESQFSYLIMTGKTEHPECEHYRGWDLTGDITFLGNCLHHLPTFGPSIPLTVCGPDCLIRHPYLSPYITMMYGFNMPNIVAKEYISSEILMVRFARFRDNVTNSLRDMFTTITEQLSHYVGKYANLLKLMGSILAGVLIMKTIVAWNTSEVVPELNPSGDSHDKSPRDKAKSSRIKAFAAAKAKARFSTPQYTTNTTIEEIISRNMGIISTMSEKNQGENRFIGICGRYIATVKHCYEFMLHNDGEVFIRMMGSERKSIGKAKDLHIIQFPESAICIIELPRMFPLFRDIRKHIQCETDVQVQPRECGVYDLGANMTTIMRMVDAQLLDSINIRDVPKDGIKEQRLELVYKYNYARPGLCGSPLVASGHQSKILGLHVAGWPNGASGHSELITKQMFDQLQTYQTSTLESIRNIDEDNQAKPNPQIDVMKLGVLPRQLVVHQCRETSLVPSLLHSCFSEPITQPAPLSRFDVRLREAVDPLESYLDNFNDIPKVFPRDIIDKCTRDLSEKLLSTTHPILSGGDVLSDQHVFGGILGFPEYKGIELSTSEGFPLCLDRNSSQHNKSYLFNYRQTDSGNILDSYHQNLQQVVDHNMRLRENNCVPTQVFVDILKDSRIPNVKIPLPGKTRVISVSPIEYTIVMKRYFGHFQASFQRSRLGNESAIGINVQSYEWTDVYNRLVAIDPSNIITGDYSHYGDLLSKDMIHACFVIICDWYDFHYPDNGNRNIRMLLCEELLNSLRMCGNLIYRPFTGIPSGFPLTVEINTLVNSLYLRSAYLSLVTIPKVSNLSFFSCLVYPLIYGDDLIVSVHSSIKHLFNFQTLQAYLMSRGIKFTDSTKDLNRVTQFEDISQSTFLKACFTPHAHRSGVIVAQRPKDNIMEILNWSWKYNDPLEAILASSRSMLVELHPYGKYEYDSMRTKLIHFFATNHKLHFRAPTWTERDFDLYQ